MTWTKLETSLWASTAKPREASAPLSGRVETDVAIVGAGYCGLSSALHLSQQDVSVVVLEAEEPGYGGSGRNNGHCVPEWMWQTPDTIAHQHGAERGERMNNFQAGAAKLVFSLIRDHQIECEAVQNGIIKVSRPGPRTGELRDRAAQWSRRGKAVRYVEQPELRSFVATDAFAGGILFEEGGHINALGFCRGLADAAERAGASIFSRSPVVGLHHDGTSWRVTTSTGATVIAETVLIATGAFRHELWPGLDQAYVPVRALGLATDAITEDLRRQVLPGDHNFQEFAPFGPALSFFFFDGDGRLVTGGSIGLGVNNTWERIQATIAKQVMKDFPQLGQVTFRHRWEGYFDVSPTKTVGVHELAPKLFAAVRFSGRGIPTATALGRELAAMIAADDPQAMAFPITPLPRQLFPGLQSAIWHNVYLPLRRYVF